MLVSLCSPQYLWWCFFSEAPDGTLFGGFAADLSLLSALLFSRLCIERHLTIGEPQRWWFLIRQAVPPSVGYFPPNLLFFYLMLLPKPAHAFLSCSRRLTHHQMNPTQTHRDTPFGFYRLSSTCSTIGASFFGKYLTNTLQASHFAFLWRVERWLIMLFMLLLNMSVGASIVGAATQLTNHVSDDEDKALRISRNYPVHFKLLIGKTERKREKENEAD